MTKKELAELDGLPRQLVLLNAFHFTPEVEPDIAAPTNFSHYVLGWSFNAHASRTYPSWSKAVAHGEGHEHTRHGAQDGVRQYSNEVLALKALRHVLEQKFASELAAVEQKVGAMNDRLTHAADYLDQLEPMFEPDGLTPPDAVKAGVLLAREYQRFADPTRIDAAWLQDRGAEQAHGSSRLDIHNGNNRLSWWPSGRTSLNGAFINERQFTRGQFRRLCELLDLRLVPQDI